MLNCCYANVYICYDLLLQVLYYCLFPAAAALACYCIASPTSLHEAPLRYGLYLHKLISIANRIATGTIISVSLVTDRVH